jgi:hypothetical protein
MRSMRSTTDLALLRISRRVRIAPLTYATKDEEVCIGIYTAKSRTGLRVLGTVRPEALYRGPLTLAVGDGTAGEFPMCGRLSKSIGSEAAAEWRRVHDVEAFEREAIESIKRFEAIETERLSKQRAQRTKRSNA